MDRVVAGAAGQLARLTQKAQGRSPKYLAWKAYDVGRKRARRSVPSHWLYADAATQTRQVIAHGNGRPLREYLLRRTTGAFFWDQGDVDAIVAGCAADEDGYVDRIVQRAEAVMAHRVDVLSLGPMDLGEVIDWQKDHRSGLRWQLQPSATIDFLDFGRPTDVRIVWELSRLQFLVDLGKAYRCTGDDRYSRAAMELVTDWDRSNPVGFGVNWTCAMEVAIRIVSLTWALVLVLPSPAVDEAFLARAIEMLLEHGIFVRSNLEYSDVRGNHYLSDLVGLAWLGFFLPESDAAAAWGAYALPRIESEMFHQVYEDGATHEGSIPYHRLVVELFLSVGMLAERNGRPFSTAYRARLSRMADFVAAYTRPDGLCPMFGDTDDGRLHVLGPQPINDHRYLLDVAGSYLARPELRVAVAGRCEEAAWLLRPGGRAESPSLPAHSPGERSQGFEQAGWYFLKGPKSYVAIDCGDVGLQGQGGHGHADALSFEAAFYGESVIVDRGSGLYTSDRERRREDVAPAGHNAVIVDGEGYGDVHRSGFLSASAIVGRVIEWQATPSTTVFEGEHEGYASKGIVHRRRVEHDQACGQVRVVDRILGPGTHSLGARFHLSPHVTAEAAGNACTIRSQSGLTVAVSVDSQSEGTWHVEPTTVYPTYGVAVPSTRLEWVTRAALPAILVFTFYGSMP